MSHSLPYLVVRKMYFLSIHHIVSNHTCFHTCSYNRFFVFSCATLTCLISNPSPIWSLCIEVHSHRALISGSHFRSLWHTWQAVFNNFFKCSLHLNFWYCFGIVFTLDCLHCNCRKWPYHLSMFLYYRMNVWRFGSSAETLKYVVAKLLPVTLDHIHCVVENKLCYNFDSKIRKEADHMLSSNAGTRTTATNDLISANN